MSIASLSYLDVVALTEEKCEETPFKSLYMRAVDKLREASSPDYLRDPETGEKTEWAIQFFAYDWLALNNVKTFMKHGAYDPFISYYKADCDLIERFRISGIDPASPPKSLAELAGQPEDDRGGKGFEYLLEVLANQTENKLHGKEERNSWQYQQQGGQGEPFYRDPVGFEAGLQIAIEAGVQTYQEKWGHKECGLVGAGLQLTDAWKIEHDWIEKPSST
ncbi:hypothetical protein OCU04_012213 [Sclerotinia nivalis]|uniref:Uncharacterized protein n=1 Tax=Sclerotinia nivalis TaxID=352851 RepID=A0A9X0AAG5_9HELO|nr:hypothetical protein OCU04_012213 [Sclerotinia nivalis]